MITRLLDLGIATDAHLYNAIINYKNNIIEQSCKIMSDDDDDSTSVLGNDFQISQNTVTNEILMTNNTG